MTKAKQEPSKYPLIDLTAISRSKRVTTGVKIFDGYDGFPWLKFGEFDLTYVENKKFHRLDARMGRGATDFEHDSAHVVILSIIGLELDLITYGFTTLVGWIDPSESLNEERFHDFHVPPPGYDPTKLPGASTCKRCKPHHPIVPEGYFVPKFDPDLYRLVAGKRIEIATGPIESNDEDE